MGNNVTMWKEFTKFLSNVLKDFGEKCFPIEKSRNCILGSIALFFGDKSGKNKKFEDLVNELLHVYILATDFVPYVIWNEAVKNHETHVLIQFYDSSNLNPPPSPNRDNWQTTPNNIKAKIAFQRILLAYKKAELVKNYKINNDLTIEISLTQSGIDFVTNCNILKENLDDDSDCNCINCRWRRMVLYGVQTLKQNLAISQNKLNLSLKESPSVLQLDEFKPLIIQTYEGVSQQYKIIPITYVLHGLLFDFLKMRRISNVYLDDLANEIIIFLMVFDLIPMALHRAAAVTFSGEPYNFAVDDLFPMSQALVKNQYARTRTELTELLDMACSWLVRQGVIVKFKINSSSDSCQIELSQEGESLFREDVNMFGVPTSQTKILH